MSVFVVPFHDIDIVGIGISFALEQNNELSSKEQNDIFGIKKIYPTVKGGREWFINMSDPRNDPNVTFTFNPKLIKQTDGSWNIKDNERIRINVNTPANLSEWKNVEITGYVKVDYLINTKDKGIISDIDWVARTDKHNEDLPCYGLSLHGGIYPEGNVGWKKEIWFTGGYTKEKSSPPITQPIIDRWIGWKTVIHNVNNDSAVKMESYLDNSNSNHWIKVFELVDDGGWFANSSDKVFYSANCGRSKDHIVLNSGPIVTFRADNVALNFKNLSIREIDSGHQ
ncbi:MAG: hypothetical protein M3162_08750 [Thermoproteota archaeon]|nr:hypothetical protein [Thermoproteota archaeon]